MSSVLDSIFCTVKLFSPGGKGTIGWIIYVFTKIRLLLLSWSSALSTVSLPFNSGCPNRTRHFSKRVFSVLTATKPETWAVHAPTAPSSEATNSVASPHLVFQSRPGSQEYLSYRPPQPPSFLPTSRNSLSEAQADDWCFKTLRNSVHITSKTKPNSQAGLPGPCMWDLGPDCFSSRLSFIPHRLLPFCSLRPRAIEIGPTLSRAPSCCPSCSLFSEMEFWWSRKR